MRITFFAILAVLAAAAGCSSDSATITPNSISTTPALADASQETGTDGAVDVYSYQYWLENPGEPGVDYDPARLTITYVDGAELPSNISAAAPPQGQRAAEQPNAVLRQDVTCEMLTDTIAATYGLAIDQQVYWNLTRMASFTLPESADGDEILAAIRRDFAGTVETAGYSMLLKRDAYIPNDPDFTASMANSYTPLWGLRKINAEDAWGYTRGSASVKIAVVDTGVRMTHEELTAQVIDPDDLDFGGVPDPWPKYVDLANGDNSMEDIDGHGTFIAGEVAGEGDNGRTIVGLAHKCKVIPIKITNQDTATDAHIIAGCALAFYLDARVISLSFGDYHENTAIESLVDDLWNAGVIFVASAGNDGVTTPHYPSDYEHAISVGATDINDSRTGFSNYSQYVDIAAPGVAIKSCGIASDSDYGDWTTSAGTSFSSPLVAAAAALVWSYDPNLTNQQVRDLLEANTDPTTGFTQGDVGRLDIGEVMAQVTPIKVDPPRPNRLVYSGAVSLTPEVYGDADSVECYLNGNLIGSLDSAPYTFSVDTSPVEYGFANIMFIARLDQLEATATLNLIVDNTAGSFPVVESFEDNNRDFLAVDVKDYDSDLITALKSLTSDWTLNDVRSNGTAAWGDVSSGAFDGFTCKAFTSASGYDGYELDALVSRRIDLRSATSPTMVFHQNYNIEDGGSDFDRARVLATADFGQTFTQLTQRDGSPALFSGDQSAWVTAEINLAAFAGSQVHLVLVFESDQYEAGENGGRDAGWWVDKITVAMDYVEDIPSIGSLSVTPYDVFGAVPEQSSFSVNVLNPDDVTWVEFILDFTPLGQANAYDVVVTDDTASFQATLDIPAGLNNQLANLIVQCYGTGDVPGPTKVVPVYIFNRLGDTNGDGAVDDSDLDGYNELIGLTSEADGYIPFYDSNLDLTITEHDAALVGYNYSGI
ncbi:S8 family serine peptidase [bacterium]|nr:S8 family serine peptidase [bacterium]